jgi:hypothetical protein
MEDARFLHRQANRCYQLAWQSFDLRVAQKLNLAGNEHTAKARELRSQESNGTPDDPRRTDRWHSIAAVAAVARRWRRPKVRRHR